MLGWITVIVVPIVRSVAGWLNNALEDAKITWPEWQQLLQTIIRIGLPSAALYWGFNLPVEIATAIPLLADLLISWIKTTYEKLQTIKGTEQLRVQKALSK
jgi:hypothetical protein